MKQMMRAHHNGSMALRALRTLLPLVAALWLAGCGAVKLAYDHGETFAMFYVGRYVDLDSQQQAVVRQRLDDLLAWHRKTQLPDYIVLAESLKAQAYAGITAAEQMSLEQGLRERGYRVLNRALPDLADIALLIRPEQLVKTQEKFAANDDEYRDDFINAPRDRQLRDRRDKWRERIEYWYGPLDDAQLAELNAMSDAQPVDASLFLQERQSREAEFIELMTHIGRDKPSRDETAVALAAFARRLESSPDPKRRDYLQKIHDSNNAIFVRMSLIANAAQRQYAVKKLGSWIEDMQAATAESS